MTIAVVNIELLGEALTGERNGPRGRVNTDYFRRFVEYIHESLVSLVGEFGGTTGSWLVVDDVLERLSFEPFEAVVYDEPRSGRPSELSEQDHERFVDALHESPEVVGIDAPAWSVPLASKYLTEEFDVDYCVVTSGGC